MTDAQKRDLERAVACCYAWRLHEAYAIFRRYFDRLPFHPEAEHAEYIGLFTRVLSELGKERELEFYQRVLEHLTQHSQDPRLIFPLAVVYRQTSEAFPEKSRQLFELILRNEQAKPYHAKAKMFLAQYYRQKLDYAACRQLIWSIDPPEDRYMAALLKIWKGFVHCFEKQFTEAEKLFLDVLKETSPESDWYGFFCAQHGLTMLFLEQGDLKNARRLVDQLKKLLRDRPSRMAQIQLKQIEGGLQQKEAVGPIQLTISEFERIVAYANQSLKIDADLPKNRLLVQFLKKRSLDKTMIIQSLFRRVYKGPEDDNLVYQYIHWMRQTLKKIGVPSKAIIHKGFAYQLLPRVNITRGESWT